MAFKGQNVNMTLSFSADTNKAKKQLADLQQTLTSVLKSTSSTKDFALTTEIKEASEAAAQLKAQLTAATDVNTGKLDLSKFSQQLSAGKTSLIEYQQTLSKLGPQGQQAFSQLAQAVMTADAKIKSTNSLLNQLGTSLYNVAKYQVSTSVLTGFTSAISSAYRYAQDLNTSLNNIRIVTGQSTDQMARFAAKANEAAKQLSTSTTEYTDAALIFYQQGLKDDDVTKRVNAVMKMAHATGDAATSVASYMTAIWNNFDDGSESLQHYADVITALGASTAASSSEIAEGLSKFAAIAETTGLSYDYATAALATLVANTRQSADTIGNSLKTIFSRLQGLSLGETLDDGVNLNKYSKALNTVGVSVLDAAGQLRNMDNILDDLAQKWENLSKAQKDALAQTVGGTRQYTQLISLMDNWDDMKTNLQTARSSTGTLDQQQKIYEESWIASQKRVKAAAEDLYSSLVDEKFFIKLNQGFADLLSVIKNVVDNLGGIQGVFVSLGAIFTQVFSSQLTGALANVGNSLKNIGVSAANTAISIKNIFAQNQTSLIPSDAEKTRSEMANALSSLGARDQSTAGLAVSETFQQQAQSQQALLSVSQSLSEVERTKYQIMMDENVALGEQVRLQSEKLRETEQEAQVAESLVRIKHQGAAEEIGASAGAAAGFGGLNAIHNTLFGSVMTAANQSDGMVDFTGKIEEIKASLNSLMTGFDALKINIRSTFGQETEAAIAKLKTALDTGNIEAVEEAYRQFGKALETSFQQAEAEATKAAIKMTAENDKQIQDYEILIQKAQEYEAKMRDTNATDQEREAALAAVIQAEQTAGISITELNEKLEQNRSKLEDVNNKHQQHGQELVNTAGRVGELKEKYSSLNAELEKNRNTTISVSQSLQKISGLVMSTLSACRSLSNTLSIINDPAKTTSEKITAIATSFTMLIPLITQVGALLPMLTSEITIFGAATGITLGPVLAVVAALTALGMAVAYANEQKYKNSIAGQLEAARKEADNLHDSLKDAQEQAALISSTFEKYDNIVTQLKNCTKGSDEFRDSLKEANQQILTLISSDSRYKNAVQVDEDGLLYIDPEERKRIDSQTSMAVGSMQVVTSSADDRVANLEAAQAQEESYNQLLKDSGFRDSVKDIVALAYAAGVGMPIQTSTGQNVIQTDIQQVLEQDRSWVNLSSQEDLEAWVSSKFDIPGYAYILAQQLFSALIDNSKIIAQSQVLDNTLPGIITPQSSSKNLQIASTAAAANIMSQEGYEAGNYSVELAGQAIAASVSRAEVDYADKTAEEVKDQLETALGGIEVTIDGSSFKFKYGDKEEIYDMSAAKAQIAAYNAQQSLESTTAIYNRGYDSAKEQADNGVGTGIAVFDFINDAQHKIDSLMTLESYRNTQSYISNNDDNTLKQIITEILGVNSEQDLLAFGFSSWEEAVAAFRDHVDHDFPNAIEAIYQSLNEAGQKTFADIFGSEAGKRLTATELADVSKVLSTASSFGALPQVSELYQKTGTSDEIVALTQLLSETDFTSIDANTFLDSVHALGAEFNDFPLDIIENLISRMQNTPKILQGVAQAYEQSFSIVAGSKFGTVIKAKEYEELGDAAKEYFIQMTDGTYRLIGNAKELQSVLKNEGLNSSKNRIDQNLLINNLSGNTPQISADNYYDVLGLLKTAGLDEDSYNKWMNTDISEGIPNIDAILEAYAKLKKDGKIDDIFTQNQEAVDEFSIALLKSSVDSKDYLANLKILHENGITTTFEEQMQGIIALASNYESCADEVEAYNQALQSENEIEIATAGGKVFQAVQNEELAASYGVTTKAVEAYMKAFSGMSFQQAAQAVSGLGKTIRASFDGLKNVKDLSKESAGLTTLAESLAKFLNNDKIDVAKTAALIDQAKNGESAFLAWAESAEGLNLKTEEAAALWTLLTETVISNDEVMKNDIATLNNQKTAWDDLKKAITSCQNILNSLKTPEQWSKLTKQQLLELQRGFTQAGLDFQTFSNTMEDSSLSSSEKTNAIVDAQTQLALSKRGTFNRQKSIYNQAASAFNTTDAALQKVRGDSFTSKDFVNEDWYKNLGPNVRGAISEAVTQGLNSGLTGADLYNKVQSILKQKSIDIDIEVANGDAALQDFVSDIYTAVTTEEQRAASETFTIWETTYKKIADARQAILEGKPFEFSDYSDFMKTYAASGAENIEQFMTALSTGEWGNLFQFNRKDFLQNAQEAMKKEMGFDYIFGGQSTSLGNTTVDAFNYNQARTNYAMQHGYTLDDEHPNQYKDLSTGEYIDASSLNNAMNQYYNVILENANYTKTEIQSIIDDASRGNEEAWSKIVEAANTHAAGISGYTSYQADAEEYAVYKSEVDVAQEQSQKEQAAWSKINDVLPESEISGKSIAELLGSEAKSVADTLGLTIEELNHLDLKDVQNGMQLSADKFQQAVNKFAEAVYGKTDENGQQQGGLTNGAALDQNGDTTGLQQLQESASAMKANAAATSDSSAAYKLWAKAIGASEEDLKTFSKYLQEEGKILETDTVNQAKHAAILYQQQRGFDNTLAHMKDYQKGLKQNVKGSNEWIKQLNNMKGLFQDAFNLSGSELDRLPNSFFESAENAKLLEKAARGDANAFDDLQANIANAMMEAQGMDGKELYTKVNIDKSELDSLIDQIAHYDFGDIPIGTELDSAPFYNELTNMIIGSKEAADAMTDALSSMGVEATIEPHTVTIPAGVIGTKNQSGFYEFVQENTGQNYTVERVPIEASVSEEQEGTTYTWYTIKGAKYNGKGVSGGAGNPPRGRGGGGGSQKRRQNKRPVRYNASNEKNANDEIERYHHIRNSLESIEHELNMIAKAKDKAFGKDKLKAIQQETNALIEQKKRQEEYLKEIQDWSKRDAGAAASIGLDIDAEGHITNYEQKMTEWIEKYNDALRQSNKQENDAINWWNGLSADAQEKEENKWKYDEKVAAAKRVAEAASLEYEENKKILEQYEETMDLLDSEEEKYQDIIDTIRDSMLEKITYAVELKIEVADDALAILQDYLSDIGDKADGASDALANFAKQAEQVQRQVQAYQGGVQDILGLAGANQGLINRALTNELTAEDWADISILDLKADDVSTLEEYMNSLLSLNQSLRDLRKDALAKVTMAFDEYNEELAKNSEKIEHLQKVNQTYINIIDIVGKKTLDASGELSRALNQANFEMQRNNTHALKSELEYIDSSIVETKRLLDEAKAANASDEVIKSLEDDLQHMNETRDSTYESWLDSWEAECQAAADIYTATLEAIVSNFESQIAGAALGLSALQEEFDRQKQIDETYLDEYDQIYQLSKLTRDINNSIDDTDNIKSKQALKKLTEEINQLQEDGTELSQYDVDVLRGKYELELAMEKLEETRNNKTAVRMTRDSEGNFGYVYTADQDAVRKAEQEYEDKLYAMQRLNSEYIDNMQEQILQAEADCSAALAELNVSDYATYEEYQAAALQIQEDYGKLVQDYYQQLENAVGNNKSLYEGAWSEYSAATGYQLGEEEKFVTDFVDTQLARLTDFATIQDASLAFNNGLNEAMNEASKAWAEWYANTQIALSDGGTSIGTYSDTVNEAISGENGLLDQAAAAEEAARKMSESYETAFSEILDSLKKFVEEWDKIIQEQITTDKLLATTIYDIIATQAGERAAILNPIEPKVGFDTGGYTGNWNSSDGKLAMLHQKELILNAEDTENILQAVDTVRYMSNILDLNAISASSGFANALRSTGLGATAANDTIEQNVSITAEFKDATTANEITAALDNLINLASQYANRKI